MSVQPIRLTLVGAGKMGAALLAGWIDQGFDPKELTAFDPAPSASLHAFCAANSIRLNPDRGGLASSQAVILAIKPQVFAAAAAEIAEIASGALVVSIMAGKTIADIRRRLPEAGPIVRCMPNTPAAVRKGIAGMAAEPGTGEAQRRLAYDLLSAVGDAVWLDDESLMNAVTAVSGSGPAYVFYLVECLAQAGVAVGLPPEVARRLARVTVEGAGALLEASPQTSAEDLRQAVTSPGGTTAAALEVLGGADGLASLMKRAVEAARRRGDELSG